MKAVNIKWDTEGYNVKLPPEAELPDNVKEDMVAEFLSDTFGFCVYSDSRLQRTKDLCNNLYFFVAYFANIWYNTQCKQK